MKNYDKKSDFIGAKSEFRGAKKAKKGQKRTRNDENRFKKVKKVQIMEQDSIEELNEYSLYEEYE